MGVVFVADGNLVARFDAQLTEQLVQTGNHFCYIAICVTVVCAIVGDTWTIPILFERILHHTNDGCVSGLEYSCFCFCQNGAFLGYLVHVEHLW